MELLRDIQNSLFSAGKEANIAKAEKVIHFAAQQGMQPIELLMGAITPTLWKIGKLWETGEITAADEHRFTLFYEKIIPKVKQETAIQLLEPTDALIVNAPGNYHYLGAQVLHLWLKSKGVHSEILSEKCDVRTIISVIHRYKPLFLGISVAIREQLAGADELAYRIRAQLGTDCPEIVTGGYAVKTGDAPPCDGYIKDGRTFLETIALKKMQRLRIKK
jgi:methanogenic corrinoid protein MtbC1